MFGYQAHDESWEREASEREREKERKTERLPVIVDGVRAGSLRGTLLPGPCCSREVPRQVRRTHLTLECVLPVNRHGQGVREEGSLWVFCFVS